MLNQSQERDGHSTHCALERLIDPNQFTALVAFEHANRLALARVQEGPDETGPHSADRAGDIVVLPGIIGPGLNHVGAIHIVPWAVPCARITPGRR